MTALNHAFIKAYRPGRTASLGGPHLPVSALQQAAATEPRTVVFSGPLFTSASWDVDAGTSVDPAQWATSEVSPEAPAATIRRIDHSHDGPQAVSPARSVRSPHWVFVPLTRRAPQSAKETQREVARPASLKTPAATDWKTLNLRSPSQQSAAVEADRRFRESQANGVVAALAEPADACNRSGEVPAEPGPSMADLTTQLPRAPIVAPQTVWLRPALEVDQFRWPESCQCIVAGAGAALDHCVQKILSTARGGRRVVMISGDERGAGRTTFLLCLAQRLSVIGIKTVLADADFANPQLARRLGLVPEAGWDDVLSGEVELAEVMIDSLADKLSLVPAVGKLRSVEQIKSQPWTKAIDILRSNYQVVLVDAPPAEEFLALDGGTISGIEAAILVQRGKSNHAANIARQLRLREINPLGQVENFVDLTVGPT